MPLAAALDARPGTSWPLPGRSPWYILATPWTLALATPWTDALPTCADALKRGGGLHGGLHGNLYRLTIRRADSYTAKDTPALMC